ncbi:SseB family protein [Allostreptomyces psammosilenae]|uniref:SseB protein N-terminal domain-containing protein n=1 Tax=Allostreptomyces psammosilenae TaxID=1892865 RepID=A0A852ZR16_9ACTN|nr:SseB family protein [Allostreptomyces psammosilenae]NYI04843.1 hypothetical protein [Allostreptomyces psammosilenae]
MTETPNSEGRLPTEVALHDLATGGDQQAALSKLAAGTVLLPEAGDPEQVDAEDPRVLRLPVFEQEGNELVPVFTSEPKLAAALPQVQRYRRVPLAALGAGWPSDTLGLAVNPGDPEALTLPGAGVRALPQLA